MSVLKTSPKTCRRGHANVYNAGTEADHPSGFGADLVPRQAAPNTGASESKPISLTGPSTGYIEASSPPADLGVSGILCKWVEPLGSTTFVWGPVWMT